MSLQLFRVTEFAESVFFSPQAQRRSIHPAIILPGYAMWLTVIGNLALWQSLKSSDPAIVLTLGLLIFSATLWVLAVLCWRATLKWVVTLLLFAAALGTCLVWFQQQPVDSAALTRLVLGPQRGWGKFVTWESTLTLLLVALMPAIVLWRVPIKRIAPGRHLLMNALFFIASYALSMWAISPKDPQIQAVVQKNLQDPSSINPINTLVAAARLVSKQVPLPAQQCRPELAHVQPHPLKWRLQCLGPVVAQPGAGFVEPLLDELGPQAAAFHAGAKVGVVIFAAAHVVNTGHDTRCALRVVKAQPLLKQGV